MNPDDVIAFWFGDLGDESPTAETTQKWFSGGAPLDVEICDRFGELITTALAGGLQDWEATPRGRVALVVVLDQFTRNAHRDTADSFAGDERALALALDALERGMDGSLRPAEAYFLLMPLMHAESLALQERCIAEFEKRVAVCAGADRERFARGADYARSHRVVIERFGRFPSRNEALGRPTTPDEAAFIAEHGSGF